jgi:hypothetical protein
MSKPFDATLKEPVASHPADWLAQLGVPVTAPPEVLTADLSTVSAAADTLIRVGDLVVHIDLESGPDDSLARRMLLYNVLAHHHTGLPVRSIVVLLRSKAVGGGPPEGVEYAPRPGSSELRFRFESVRAWELPADGQTREQALPGVVARIAERAAEAKAEAGKLLTAAYILSSMHVEPRIAQGVFNRVAVMHESGTYQLIHPRRRRDSTRAPGHSEAGPGEIRRTDREAEERVERDRRPGAPGPERTQDARR